MRDNNLMRDGDWMTKKEAARDNLPAHFTDQDIQAKLKKVGRGLMISHARPKSGYRVNGITCQTDITCQTNQGEPLMGSHGSYARLRKVGRGLATSRLNDIICQLSNNYFLV